MEQRTTEGTGSYPQAQNQLECIVYVSEEH